MDAAINNHAKFAAESEMSPLAIASIKPLISPSQPTVRQDTFMAEWSEDVLYCIIRKISIGNLTDLRAFACTSKPALRIAAPRISLELLVVPPNEKGMPKALSNAEFQNRVSVLRAQSSHLDPREGAEIVQRLIGLWGIDSQGFMQGIETLLDACALIADTRALEELLDNLICYVRYYACRLGKRQDLDDALVKFCSELPPLQGATCLMLSRLSMVEDDASFSKARQLKQQKFESILNELEELPDLPHASIERVLARMLRESNFDVQNLLPRILAWASRIDTNHGSSVLCAAARQLGSEDRVIDAVLRDADLIISQAKDMGTGTQVTVWDALAHSMTHMLRGYHFMRGGMESIIDFTFPSDKTICRVYGWLAGHASAMPAAAGQERRKHLAAEFFEGYPALSQSSVGQELRGD